MTGAEKDAVGLSLTHMENRVPEALRVIQQQALSLDSSPDTVLHWHNAWLSFKRAIKELDGEHAERMVEWLEEHGDLPINDEERLRVAIEWSEKCRDVEWAFDSLLTETGGDVEKIAPCLSSNALKPAAAAATVADCRRDRELMRDAGLLIKEAEWDSEEWLKREAAEWRKEHFERKSRKCPKTGKLKKSARVVQNRYLPKKEDRDGDSGE